MGTIRTWLRKVLGIEDDKQFSLAYGDSISSRVDRLESPVDRTKRVKQVSGAQLTGAQLRRLNEQENARFLEDRGEPTNSEILKEQANG